MAKKKIEKFELANLNANNLTVFTGLENKQKKLVKDNPYIDVVDNKTYQIAKTRRTALRTGRTTLEKGDKLIGSAVSTFRKATKQKNEDLVAISKPNEDKQQEPIDKWEEKIAKKAQDKIDDENQRVEDINKEITSKKEALETITEEVLFSTIDKKTEEFNELVESSKEYDYQEFDLPYEEMIDVEQKEFDSTVKDLKTKETERIEEEAKAEIKRLEELKQAQVSETNRLFRLSTETIDNYSLKDKEGLLDNLQVCVFDSGFDFGDQKEEFDKLVKSSTKKAEERVKFLNSEKVRIENEEKETTKLLEEKINLRESELVKLKLVKGEFQFKGLGALVLESNIKSLSKIEWEELISVTKSNIRIFKHNDKKEKIRQRNLKPLKEQGLFIIKNTVPELEETKNKEVDALLTEFREEFTVLRLKFNNKINDL